jgi:hypothetical protein
MRFNDCRCGNDKFEMKGNGKMACTACGKNFNPFSAIHEKVIKEDGFHFFWAIFTPHFIERLEERVPDAEGERNSNAQDGEVSTSSGSINSMREERDLNWNL